jgi:HEPN domain-containing protein
MAKEHLMYPLDIQLDMEEAKHLLFNPPSKLENNVFRINKACFYCEQVIEKIMKYDLEVTLKPEEYKPLEKTHNISALCIKMAEHNKHFSKKHPFLVKYASEIGKLNSARYGHFQIEESDAQKIYMEAKNMYNEFVKIHTNVMKPQKSNKVYKKLPSLFEKD